MEIKYELTKTPKEKPTGALGFGHIFTDHMFVMDYDEGKGWHDADIVPISRWYWIPPRWCSTMRRSALRV